MRLLLDTHLLLWAGLDSPRLPRTARMLLEDTANTRYFSVASLWEIGIKRAQGQSDFQFDVRSVRSGLLSRAFREILINGEHAAYAGGLPSLHKDPFDRMLVAQATLEQVSLLTSDPTVARYPGPIQLV